MKRSIMTTALFLSLASNAGFAHHPAEDMVDPEIYAMIDENVADTPHADMVFDDMGRDLVDAGASGSMSGDMGADMGGEMADSGSFETRNEMSSMEMSSQMDARANENRGRQDR